MGSGLAMKYLEWKGIFVKLAQCTAIDERGASFISSSISPLYLSQFRFFFDLDRTGMQDVHEILGGGAAGSGGRIFGDRRMRATPHGHHHQQALKCPRCDSLNTKFCYYNNYNLSQPRHFCKNCRRYWTKGGVLRNVPVGGGCRKPKRSSKRKPSDSPSQPLSSAAMDRHISNSGSSSESTSPNAAKTDIGCSSKAIGVAKVVSEAGSEYSSSTLFTFSEQPPATFNNLATTPVPLNATFEGRAGIRGSNSGNGGVFREAGSFVSLTNGDQNQNLLGFTNAETTPFGLHQQSQVNNQLLLQNLSSRDWQKEKMDGVDNWGQGVFDQTVHVDLLSNGRTGDGVLAGGNWHGVPGGGGVGDGGGHLGMFDLTPGSDWSQSSQWHESDHHLYLPP